ncbi:MAG: hypothetical protein Q3M24_10795 [Candidatus Electrothrix aestuarii]|jgi:sulfate adenylyltransferase subunit 1 (EFTu-like GTPase family)|uniref:Uncharacterized protein n=1 Tax=Candidatus Electrothrix aestuarii TaxID=3062594 RepID=A0AAU8M257_9BACT|nr:hypothetical protein [Candidatus Electrothrix aestuarii]WPD24157.1 MAG: hypothetical protein SD837_06285 [Candidatus Electrothrix sp. GW3-3]
MLQKMKSGSVKVALMLTLAASAFAVSNVQAIEIPIPTGDAEIQTVVNNTKNDTMVKDMMNATRADVIVNMSAAMPLKNQVMAKMQPMMMNKIMQTQMDALKNPNGGIPGSIAPPPF